MDFNFDKRKQTWSTSKLKNSNSSKICEKVNDIFKKSFTIQGNETFLLPKPELMFVESGWEIEEMQMIKKELNEIKSQLNDYNIEKWNYHTTQRNKAKDVEWRLRNDYDPEFVTQAWCKFHEIISKYPLVPKEQIFTNNNKLLSLHLCEAPGAFITCLNHFLKTKLMTVHWDWLAMTFNPYYEGNACGEMISDDRFILHTLSNWYFGEDGSGNIMKVENLEGLIKKCKSKGKIHLITADGSINCTSNPSEQEAIVADLHFCEVVAAVHILEPEGNFLLKTFTTFEHKSICLIYFLSCIFRKVHFYKPVTSKEGNSEVYVICLGFKGSKFVLPYLPVLKKQYGKTCPAAMFSINNIPSEFIKQLTSCAYFFKNCQSSVIIDNIVAYNEDSDYYESKKIRKLVADMYFQSFPIEKLHLSLQIIGNAMLKKGDFKYWVTSISESYTERNKKKMLSPDCQLFEIAKKLKFHEQSPQVLIFKSHHNSTVDVCLSIGKPFKQVKSSRFCSVDITQINNLLLQTLNMEENKSASLPSEQNIREYISKIQSGTVYKIKHFKYSEPINNNQTIEIIYHTLLKSSMGMNLLLIGYQLLSTFNVGLVYLLSHTFEIVEFHLNAEVGCCIILKNFKNEQLIIQNIKHIYDMVKQVLVDDKTVLSVVSVAQLNDSELYPLIHTLNNWIAKYCTYQLKQMYEARNEKNQN